MRLPASCLPVRLALVCAIAYGAAAAAQHTPAPALLAGPAPALVLGTPSPDSYYGGSYLRRIYRELFSRMGLTLEIATLPVARLNAELDNNRLDGDTARGVDFGAQHPALVRVPEPVLETAFALWATDPGVQPSSWEQLKASGHVVSYSRGVLECEQVLRAHLPAERVVDVTSLSNGLEMLHYGRHALHCGADLAVQSFARANYPHKPAPRRLFNVTAPIALYAYLQPQHAALAPSMAAALRKMRADGTLERIRRETLRDFELPVN
ncbi:MAG: hypothetical protein ACT4NV_06960 [Rhodoferax sp.]